jgi:aspartyl aminopeptidase
MTKQIPSSVSHLLKFIDQSPTPFHAVETVQNSLIEQGAIPLSESDTWTLEEGKTYFVTRNQSSIIAFQVPRNTNQSRYKYHIIAAHTDSPCLKLKPLPIPVETTPGNYIQWGVEVYGGALLNTWLDKDLYIAGRIVYEQNGTLHTQMVNWNQYPVRIPQLAIHLDRDVNQEGLKLNPQKHLTPILGLQEKSTKYKTLKEWFDLFFQQQPSPTGTPIAHDLFLYDANPSAIGGLNNEFIYAPRLDNLAMCHGALEAFHKVTVNNSQNATPILALFDNEEVGSESSHGASSPFLSHILERISLHWNQEREEHLASLTQSYILSADMAHAIHPNYPDRHDPHHAPKIGNGPVLKGHAKLRYATSAITGGYFKALCKQANIPVQDFSNRSDLGCGSTLGPLLSTTTGIPAMDVGTPMLSMHSCREMAGTQDHPWMIQAFFEFLKG